MLGRRIASTTIHHHSPAALARHCQLMPCIGICARHSELTLRCNACLHAHCLSHGAVGTAMGSHVVWLRARATPRRRALINKACTAQSCRKCHCTLSNTSCTRVQSVCCQHSASRLCDREAPSVLAAPGRRVGAAAGWRIRANAVGGCCCCGSYIWCPLWAAGGWLAGMHMATRLVAGTAL